MTRQQLRDDFEQTFSNADQYDLSRTKDDKEYKSFRTQSMWHAWVSSFETYSNDHVSD